MSMGSKAFQPKGVGVTTGTAKNLGKLGKQLAHARQMKENPHLNPNGSINTNFTKDLGRGFQGAEDFFRKIEDSSVQVRPGIYKGMGGPPKIAS